MTLARDDLEARLTAVEARIRQLKPPKQRFTDGEPNPALEARVRPILDRVFQLKPGEPAKYRLSCRGDTCEFVPSAENRDWMERIQAPPDRAWFEGMDFSAPGVYLEVATPSDGANRWLTFAILEAAEAAGVSCTRTIEAKGSLTLQLHLDPTTRRVTASLSGELVEHEIARCLQRAFDDAIARTPVPPDATQIVGEPLEFTFPLPVDD